MAATGNTFAVGILELDAKLLTTQLTVAESKFTDSVGIMQTAADQAASQMQDSFARVSPSINKISTSAVDAGRAMTGMSNTATLLGGSLGFLVSQGIAAVEVIRNITLAMSGPVGWAVAAGLVAVAIGVKLTSAWNDAKVAAQEAAKAAQEALEKQAEALIKFDLARLTLEASFGDDSAAKKVRFQARLASGLTGPQIGDLRDREAALQSEKDDEARKDRLRARAKEEQRQLLALENARRRLQGKDEILPPAISELVRRKTEENKLLAKQLAIIKAIEDKEKSRLAIKESQQQADRTTVTSLAQQLLIQAGLAKASEFEENPNLRRLLEISEAVETGAGPAALSRGATGGLRNARLGGGVAIATSIGNKREETKVKLLTSIDENIAFIKNQAGIGINP